MTATSGPGFCLMQEAIGLAVAEEAPCVIVNVMRGGPCSGQSTSTAQGDLYQARYGSNGDYSLICLAPSDAQEMFDYTIKAFNLAERFRIPVIILSDEVVAHTREKIYLPHPGEIEVLDRIRPNTPPEWYIPYEDNPRGVPPMGIFGDGYRYHVTGLIHDVRGFPTQRPDEIVPFMNRLFRKINQHFYDIQLVEQETTEDAEVLIIAYGSVARSALRSVREARNRGVKAGLLQLVTLWPFPRQIVEPLLRRVRAVLVPELNMGQVSREVKRINQGTTRVETLNRIDGNLITPAEILVRLLKL